MIKDIAHVSVDFTVIPMFLLHNIQHVAVDEIKAREHAMFEHLKHQGILLHLSRPKCRREIIKQRYGRRTCKDWSKLLHWHATNC